LDSNQQASAWSIGYLLRSLQKETGHAKPFTNPLTAEKEERQMTGKQHNAKTDWKSVMTQGADWMKSLIQEVVQQVLEAEMH